MGEGLRRLPPLLPALLPLRPRETHMSATAASPPAVAVLLPLLGLGLRPPATAAAAVAVASTPSAPWLVPERGASALLLLLPLLVVAASSLDPVPSSLVDLFGVPRTTASLGGLRLGVLGATMGKALLLPPPPAVAAVAPGGDVALTRLLLPARPITPAAPMTLPLPARAVPIPLPALAIPLPLRAMAVVLLGGGRQYADMSPLSCASLHSSTAWWRPDVPP